MRDDAERGVLSCLAKSSVPPSAGGANLQEYARLMKLSTGELQSVPNRRVRTTAPLPL